MNAIWLTIVASSVVNVCTDSTDGFVHESPNDNETIAENAQTNSSFDMIFDTFFLYWNIHLNEVANDVWLFVLGELFSVDALNW